MALGQTKSINEAGADGQTEFGLDVATGKPAPPQFWNILQGRARALVGRAGRARRERV